VFIALRKRVRRGFLLGSVSGAALLVLAVGQASATTYPGGGSSFTGSGEGWKVASSECKVGGLLELLCTNTGTGYDATVGVPPGSFAAKAQIPLDLIGLFKSNVVAESPAFTAAGSGAGSLSLSRSFVAGGLIGLNHAYTYTVDLIDKTTNAKQKAVTETIETEAPFATKAGAVSLVAGHSYAIRIEAATSASVLGAFTETAGYFDNVVVSGPDAPESPGGGGNPGANGGHGGAGGNGGEGTDGGSGEKGGGGVSAARLESLIKSSSLVGAATLKGNRLTVKAKCPAKVGTTCTLSLQGMLNRHKAATAGRRARVRQGKVKKFALVVKPAARKAVHKRSRLLFKEKVRAGKAKATVYKSIKLVRK
jgi:hypothetical protein